MLPDVSVLLPYRDAADSLPEALAGLLAERGPRLELVLVDDGSIDGSGGVVTRCVEGASCIHLRTRGVGIAKALELARCHARAPYLARMDADDRSHPGRIEKEAALLDRDAGLAAVGCRVGLFGDAIGEGLARYVAWQNGLITRDEHARELFVESPLCHPSVTLRASAVASVGGYRDPAWAEDYDLFLRLDAAGHGLAKVEETLFDWRHREGRLTFRDPRYTPEQFRDAKAAYLAPKLAATKRALVVWGAGPSGRRFARALEAHGVRASMFVDIDPRKIGRVARAVPIVAPDGIPRGAIVVVSVASRGARALIRTELVKRGLVEGVDFHCAA